MMMINRRRVCGGKSLPYDYEVEYLGYGAILAPVTLSSLNFKIYAKVKTDRVPTKNDACGFSLYNYQKSPWDENYTTRIVQYEYYNGEQFYYQLCGVGRGEAFHDKLAYFINKEVEVEVGNKYLKDITDNIFIQNLSPVTSQRWGNVAPTIKFNNARFYYYKMYVDNTCVCDLIPVVKDNVGYMYDKISKRLFGNQGTGDFVLGPEV